MHDIKAIRDNPAAFVAGWSSRGVEEADKVVADILALDRELRAAQTRAQEALAQRNAASKAIGAAMGRKDMAEADRLKGEVESLKGVISDAEGEADAKGRALRDLLAGLKNLAADDVPDGEDETANVQVGEAWGVRRAAGPAKDHADLGEALGLLDFEAAARMSGARFAVLKGGLARLERAIGQFMLDMQTGRHGYLEVNPPYLVRDEAVFGTGQLPKFADDLFLALPGVDELNRYAVDFAQTVADGIGNVADPRFSHPGSRQQVIDEALARHDPKTDRRAFEQRSAGHWLIPTAEVSLTNLVREQILSEDELSEPMRLTALTPCFRAEAGSAGRDTRGLIRQHQFSKVELVSITRPEDSEAEHERMTECAEAVLKALDLPFRRMLLCKGDMGFSARKTYDLEVWLPSQGTYREISSCSNCGDFQARRMNARYRPKDGKGPRYVHTLNGSGVAVGRALIAVIENYQNEDGSVTIPEALQPYMGGLTKITKATA